ESAAVEFVRTGLGNDIDYGSPSPAKLRRKAILIYLEFLYRFFRKLIRRAHAAAAQGLSEEGVVVVYAIDLKAVECSALAANGQVAAARIANYGRRKRCKILKVTSVNWQVINRFLINSRGNGGTRGFHNR